MNRDNILFIFPDQWRGDCLSIDGHHTVRTPALDQLASEGIRFTSAYSPCPTCIATRASLMTGRTPFNAGRVGYRDGIPWTYENMFPELMRNAGYETMLSGKTHFYPQRTRCGFERIELYDTQKHDAGFESDYEGWLRSATNGTVRDTAQEMSTNSWMVKPWTNEEALHPNSWTTAKAIEMLEKRDPLRPFMLQLGYHRPHPPLDPPVEYFDRYLDADLPPVPVGDWAAENDIAVTNAEGHSIGRLHPRDLDLARKAYYAQLEHLDWQIGRMLNYLRRSKLLDSTWVVFCSDHGELLGDHHSFRKTVPWEGSSRVPLIVKAPNGRDVPRNEMSGAAITHADIMPTFLEIADIGKPETVDGESLLPIIQGSAVRWREFVHGEHAPFWHFVTDGREKFAWHSGSGKEWYFDLQADPCELHNAIKDPASAEQIAKWRERLIQTLASRPEGLVNENMLVAGTQTHAVVEDSL